MSKTKKRLMVQAYMKRSAEALDQARMWNGLKESPVVLMGAVDEWWRKNRVAYFTAQARQWQHAAMQLDKRGY